MKAMVLCAGAGTRLGALTRATPKPMLPLGGQPLLAYILCQLRRHGYDQIAINLHFHPRAITDYFGDGARFGVRITYSHEEQPLGTAGGVKRMEAFFRDQPEFLVHYGDILTDQDWSAMLRFHRERQGLVTLLVHQRKRSNSVVSLDRDSRVVRFLERPAERERRAQTSPWVNSGVCLCSPEVFATMPDETPLDLPRDVFPRLLQTRRVFGFPLTRYRCAIDSAARLSEARAALAEGRCKIHLGR